MVLVYYSEEEEHMNSVIDPAAHSPLDLFQRTYRSLLRSSGEIQIWVGLFGVAGQPAQPTFTINEQAGVPPQMNGM